MYVPRDKRVLGLYEANGDLQCVLWLNGSVRWHNVKNLVVTSRYKIVTWVSLGEKVTLNPSSNFCRGNEKGGEKNYVANYCPICVSRTIISVNLVGSCQNVFTLMLMLTRLNASRGFYKYVLFKCSTKVHTGYAPSQGEGKV